MNPIEWLIYCAAYEFFYSTRNDHVFDESPTWRACRSIVETNA